MKQPISILSYPKVNLALDILAKEASGYHEIQTIFLELSAPVDEIIVEEHARGIELSCSNPKLPLDETNTVRKAAELLRNMADISQGAHITIQKNIPLMSGLGGGSSNAVAALKALVELWKVKCCTGLRHRDRTCMLRRVADQIGMDCGFFFFGGTALGSHFGEVITPLPALPRSIHTEVMETGVEVSSRLAYDLVNMKHCGKGKNKTGKMIEALKQSDAQKILENLHNDFEPFIFGKFPELLRQKIALEKKHPEGRVMLCGSGGSLMHISCRV